MKYTHLKFQYGNLYQEEVDSLNDYVKNCLYSTFGDHHMYVDTDKIEAGKKKFKKALLEYYKHLTTTIELI